MKFIHFSFVSDWSLLDVDLRFSSALWTVCLFCVLSSCSVPWDVSTIVYWPLVSESDSPQMSTFSSLILALEESKLLNVGSILDSLQLSVNCFRDGPSTLLVYFIGFTFTEFIFKAGACWSLVGGGFSVVSIWALIGRQTLVWAGFGVFCLIFLFGFIGRNSRFSLIVLFGLVVACGGIDICVDGSSLFFLHILRGSLCWGFPNFPVFGDHCFLSLCQPWIGRWWFRNKLFGNFLFLTEPREWLWSLIEPRSVFEWMLVFDIFYMAAENCNSPQIRIIS